MVFIYLINNLAAPLAALLIFVVGYLVLILSVIAGLVLANLIYSGARLLWSRVMARRASRRAVPAKGAGAARRALSQGDIAGPHFVVARRSHL